MSSPFYDPLNNEKKTFEIIAGIFEVFVIYVCIWKLIKVAHDINIFLMCTAFKYTCKLTNMISSLSPKHD